VTHLAPEDRTVRQAARRQLKKPALDTQNGTR